MKNSKFAASLLLLSLVLTAGALAEDKPARQIFGLRLGMKAAEAHERLKAIAHFVRNEPDNQEVWTVRDPSFSHILIGLADDGELRYVTVLARKDKEAKRVSYASIGDLGKARQAGNAATKFYNYQWMLPAANGEPATLVIALGRDPEHLNMHSLKRLGPEAD